MVLMLIYFNNLKFNISVIYLNLINIIYISYSFWLLSWVWIYWHLYSKPLLITLDIVNNSIHLALYINLSPELKEKKVDIEDIKNLVKITESSIISLCHMVGVVETSIIVLMVFFRTFFSPFVFWLLTYPLYGFEP